MYVKVIVLHTLYDEARGAAENIKILI